MTTTRTAAQTDLTLDELMDLTGITDADIDKMIDYLAIWPARSFTPSHIGTVLHLDPVAVRSALCWLARRRYIDDVSNAGYGNRFQCR